ncbi:cytochrome b5 reductase 4 [Drosophila innubila]|uniref:cytochrome b5 reductase 4 n=1 Tax=Drosophila innubila TaxID=198719 RepID=UPI00148C73C4|nr:cytochrome b5 reductase 4 [Drosophila innubila]
MSDSTFKPPTQIDKTTTLKPPAVSTLSVNSLQLPSSAPQRLTGGSNGTSSGSGSATGNPRNKCALKPGYSLMSWVRLCNSGADLAGTGGRVVPVSRSELARHNQVNDAWMAIRGRVFNVTRYMDFHPGGVDELMRGVGRDATKLFDEVHAWVNYPQLLGKCYVGPLKEDVGAKVETEIIRPPPVPVDTVPRFDWIQQRSELTLCFYTRRLANPGLLLKRSLEADDTLELRVQLADSWHRFSFQLSNSVEWPPKTVRVAPETGKIEVVLVKQLPEPWTTYGTHETSKLDVQQVQEEHFDFEVLRCEHFNHDSFELSLQSVRQQVLLQLPVGYHLDIQLPQNGELLQRSYTPVPHNYLPSNSDQVDTEPSPTTSQQFLIKYYENGVVSRHLHQLNPGQIVQLSLPRGNLNLSQLEAHRHILLLAAGSGITPILSLLRPLLKRQANRIERLQLLYFNKTASDIWLRDKLQALQDFDERFSCSHILSKAEEQQTQTGRICQELLAPLFKEQLSECFSYVTICGPTGFNSAAVDSLTGLKLKLNQIHVFQA